MQNKTKLKSIYMLTFAKSLRSLKQCKFQCFIAVVGVSIGLTGCYRSVSPNFYTLTPQITPLVSSNIKLIEVVPVGIPARLDTPLLVIQNSNGQSYMLDNQRWTSSLGNELQSGLSAGLQQKLGAIDVYNTGLTGGKTVYTIATEFSRFDIVEKADKSATDIEVMASWVIKRNTALNTQTKNAEQYSYNQLNCRMTFKNAVNGKSSNFIDIVSTYQNSLNKVIEAISHTTISMDTNKKPSIEGVLCS